MPSHSKEQIIQVEQACLRLVVRAIRDYYKQAVQIFKEETDEVGDIAEDVTREALVKYSLVLEPPRRRRGAKK